jgi:hypothetical protein
MIYIEDKKEYLSNVIEKALIELQSSENNTEAG